MKRHRIIVSTVALLAGLAVAAPAGARSGGPLLSGYGGPGSGAQVILGATLLNGPSGGPGGGGESGGPVSGGGSQFARGSSEARATGTTAGVLHDGHSSTGQAGRAPGGDAVVTGTRSARPGASASASATYPGSVHGISPAASTTWFSVTDVLLLVLVGGALALMGLTTVRLGRAQHD
jgi:hypothetical protein